MSTATVLGTISYPLAPSGTTATFLIGAPSVTSSTTGFTLTFTEASVNTYSVAQADGVVTIPFGTLTDGDILYLGTDQALDVILNGGTDTISLAVGGFILIANGSCTAATVQASTINTATVQVAILGS